MSKDGLFPIGYPDPERQLAAVINFSDHERPSDKRYVLANADVLVARRELEVINESREQGLYSQRCSSAILSPPH